MNITPDQADTLAANYVEPHEMPDCPDAVELWESAYDLAQTIAGMTWQHAVEVYNADAKCWIQTSNWISHRKVAEQDIDAYSRVYGGAPIRLVRRLVGPTEPVDQETPND